MTLFMMTVEKISDKLVLGIMKLLDERCARIIELDMLI